MTGPTGRGLRRLSRSDAGAQVRLSACTHSSKPLEVRTSRSLGPLTKDCPLTVPRVALDHSYLSQKADPNFTTLEYNHNTCRPRTPPSPSPCRQVLTKPACLVSHVLRQHCTGVASTAMTRAYRCCSRYSLPPPHPLHRPSHRRQGPWPMRTGLTCLSPPTMHGAAPSAVAAFATHVRSSSYGLLRSPRPQPVTHQPPACSLAS